MKKITTYFSMVLLVICVGLTSCDDVIDNPSGPVSVKVTAITLDAEKMTMEIGEVGQLNATVTPEDATDKTVTWTSSKESVATVEHEATTSKINEDQLFYCNQRGISTEEAVGLIVNGYAKDVLNKLPMEFAVEAQKLLSVSLEGTVG